MELKQFREDTKLNEIFKPGFIETIADDSRLMYADTDSSYSYIKLPFNKFKDIHKTVDYTQVVAKACNTKYTDIFNTLLKEKANINPDYNFMNFKSEVVAFRGFFNTKKFYALGKIWDEGTFFQKLKIKKTGGQILKSDCTDLTYNMLSEIYDLMTVRTEIKDKYQIEKMIFIDLKNKYQELLARSINDFNFPAFVIPKKWGLGDFKNIPNQVKGAMLYNALFENTLRPGDSLNMVQLKINKDKVYQYLSNKYKKLNKDDLKYLIDLKDVNSKLNIISFPSTEFDKEKINNIKNLFNELDIKFDYDKIMDFNINMKLEQFKKLFST